MAEREEQDYSGRIRPGHPLFERFFEYLREASMGRFFGLWTSVLATLCLIFSVELLLDYRAAEGAAEFHSRAMAFASELRSRADRELNAAMYLTGGLSAYFVVRHDAIVPSEVNALLGQIHSQGRLLRNIAVAVGYRTAYVFPPGGNESIVGRDYRELPEQWPMVKYAIEHRSGVLTGPVRLVQGGKAMIYRLPVFVGQDYWGILACVIDIEAFYDAAFRDMADGRFEFAVRSVEPRDRSGGVLWGSAELFRMSGTVQLESDVPGGAKWVFAVRNLEKASPGLHWGLRVFGWLVALFVGLAVHTVLRQRRDLAQHAGVDLLTELPNRRLFDDRLEHSLRRHMRDGNASVALIFLDLNGFKKLNDDYGHRFGDAVLRVVARRLREEVRPADTVARWGGDEYAILVEDVERASVEQLVERLRGVISAPFRVGGVAVAVRASIGTAYYPNEAVSAEGLLELADQRMYADKEALSAAEH